LGSSIGTALPSRSTVVLRNIGARQLTFSTCRAQAGVRLARSGRRN